jgi:hypothetical protein
LSASQAAQAPRDKRRSDRLAVRFTVAVREKLAMWVTATQDVSARGCRIELKRPLNPGMLVQLAFDMGAGAEPLVVHGQVAWVSRGQAQQCAGIAFLSVPRQPSQPAPANWIDRVLAAPARPLTVNEPTRPTPRVGTHAAIILPPVA